MRLIDLEGKVWIYHREGSFREKGGFIGNRVSIWLKGNRACGKRIPYRTSKKRRNRRKKNSQDGAGLEV